MALQNIFMLASKFVGRRLTVTRYNLDVYMKITISGKPFFSKQKIQCIHLMQN